MVTKTKRKHRKNKTRKKNLFKKLNCSPSADGHSFSCYSNEDLFILKRTWNEKYPNIEITTNDPKLIWRMLKFYLKRKCDKESCWTSELIENQKEKSYLLDSFSPKSPLNWKKNPNEWLSSVEIINVMKQYEKAYKCFKFIGPSPIDFDDPKSYGGCVWEDLCRFNLKNYIKNKKYKIGIIFNTDPHYKDGEHWISLFINCKKKFIYFFDSVGHPAPKEIEMFANRIIIQGEKMNPPIKLKFDQSHPVEHQNRNAEFGVYSLYFIVHMLKDKFGTEYLKTKILPDEYIQQFRKIYFNEDL